MIVGATKVLNDDKFHKKDGKGRFMWNMPDPIGEVEHKFNVKEKMQFGEKIVKVPQTKIVKVPVYRGYAESDLNYFRSQRAYMMRQAEKRRIEQAKIAYESYTGNIKFDKGNGE